MAHGPCCRMNMAYPAHGCGSVRPKRSRRLVAMGEDAEPIRCWSGAEGARAQLSVVSGGARRRDLSARSRESAGGARLVAAFPGRRRTAGSGWRSFGEYLSIKDFCYKIKGARPTFFPPGRARQPGPGRRWSGFRHGALKCRQTLTMPRRHDGRLYRTQLWRMPED
jgi:hypothetical protein